MIEACIFDLDGVIVDTAKYHFIAWGELAQALGTELTLEDNEKLKGISRMDSLEFILSKGNIELSQEQKLSLANKKNERYLALIRDMNATEILPGVLSLISELQQAQIKIALGSASRNASNILEKLKLTKHFEAIVDGNMVKRSKPDPEVFNIGAKKLQVVPGNTIVFEDSIKGLIAAKSGGFRTVGIGDEQNLNEAELTYSGFNEFTLEDLKSHFG